MWHVYNGMKWHEAESSVCEHEMGMYHWHEMYCGMDQHEYDMYVMSPNGMKRSPACVGMKWACIIGMYWHEMYSDLEQHECGMYIMA